MTRDLGSAKAARFGQYRVDLRTWEVSGEGRRVRLQEKPFLVLLALLERPGELVTRSELSHKLWNDGTVVDFDNNLNSAVATLRATLGDSAKSPQLIETLPRQGYRLIADVSIEPSDPSRSDEEGPAEEQPPEATPESEDPEQGGASGTPRDRRRTGLVWVVGSMTAALVVLAAGAKVFPGRSEDRPRDPGAAGGPATSVDPPADPVARRAWQRGLYLVARESTGDRTRAVESFREVLREEPDFAPAHVKIAETLSKMCFEDALDIREGLTQARISARRARALGDASAAPLRIQALAHMHLEWDFAAAGRDIESALRIDPKDAEIYLAAATLFSAVGNDEAAVLAARRAVELDPASSLLRADLGYFLVAAERYAEAVDVCRETLEVDPGFIHSLNSIMVATERLGRFEESLVAARRILELRGGDESEIRALSQSGPVDGLARFRSWDLANARSKGERSSFRLALKHAALGQNDEALSLLERAFEEKEPWLVYLRGHAQLDGLRDDPRFIELEADLGTASPGDGIVDRVVDQVESLCRAGPSSSRLDSPGPQQAERGGSSRDD